MKAFKYPGAELDVFRLAVNWKRYWTALISPYISGRVLEVGAGTGNNTGLIQSACQGRFSAWTCLEPDLCLVRQLKQKIGRETPAGLVDVIHGTIADLSGSADYNSVLYIDVLEHIENDCAEIQAAAELLSTNGHLIVLSPAHTFLYTEFDRRIGHFRRYTVDSLKQLTPAGLIPVLSRYMDSAGMLTSLANRVLLRQGLPTSSQIKTWDRILIPLSRILDTVVCGKLGRSVLVVWEKIIPDNTKNKADPARIYSA